MPHFDYNSADRDILGFLHDVADAAADTLDEIADWSMSGEREGQYSADVVIDDVIVDLLSLATDGEWPRGLREEVLAWVSAHRKELMEEWQKWHP